jgi:hypothetical protein
LYKDVKQGALKHVLVVSHGILPSDRNQDQTQDKRENHDHIALEQDMKNSELCEGILTASEISSRMQITGT